MTRYRRGARPDASMRSIDKAADDSSVPTPEPATEKKQPARVVMKRRSLIFGGGLVGLGLLGGGTAIGSILPQPAPAAPTAKPDDSAPVMRQFATSDLTVPDVTSWRYGPVTPGLLFVAQKVKTYGGLIMQESGEPVWIEPTNANVTDLRVQTFEGKPVLTYWSGKIIVGHGQGKGTILDTTYAPVATVKAGNGLKADLHEFNLTSAGTALISAFSTVPVDLSSIGGPAKGYMLNCHVQEIDVRTGTVLLDWNAMDHIAIGETYFGFHQHKDEDGTSAESPFDPFHLNAIDADGDRLLVSLRHTHAIYAINRTSGEVLWRFGGKKSDITVDTDAVFAWQHDVRTRPDGTISLFDNHLYSGTKAESRGMIFRLDEKAKTSTLVQQYTYDRHLGTAMGSVQTLPNGNVLVGWGVDPAVTEFTSDGKAVYEATLGGTSYRAARHTWTAHPTTSPAIAAKKDGANVRVSLSWNGATEISHWRILVGEYKTNLQHSVSTPCTGFETALLIAPAKRVSAEALDASGTVLGTTATISV